MGRSSTYVGRLAPSPTGYLHLGNARTFLLTWLHARASAGRLILRLEDLNYPRIDAATIRGTYEDLAWLGLDWDDAPIGANDASAIDNPPGDDPFVQRDRYAAGVYAASLRRLQAAGLVEPCTCTRKDMIAALDAPHEGDEMPYANRCRGRWRDAAEAEAVSGRVPALRFRVSPGISRIDDGIAGPHELDLASWSGDFVLQTRPDRLPSYHLAVVTDDIEMGVTHIIRGADLLPSAHRHAAIYRALGATLPTWSHVPLLRDEGGRRLAKRDGDTRIAHLRELGIPPTRVIGWLAHSLGLRDRPGESTARELLPKFDLARVPRTDAVVTAADRRYLGLAT